MTNVMSRFAFAAGVLLLLLGTFRATAVRAARRAGTGPSAATVKSGVLTPVPTDNVVRMQLSKDFAIFFVGGTSVAFSDDLVTTALGATICAGLALYLGLEVWGKTRRSEGARPLLAIDTLLYLAPAICYAIAAASRLVI